MRALATWMVMVMLAACGGGEAGDPDDPAYGVCQVTVSRSDGPFEIHHYIYDDDGRLIRLETPDGDQTYTYDGDRLVAITGDVWRYENNYDGAGLLLFQDLFDLQFLPDVPTDRWTYSYDGQQRRTRKLYDRDVDQVADGNTWYYYDASSRLVTEEIDETGFGDIFYEITHTYDADDRKAMESAVYTAGGTYYTVTYHYDSDGRLSWKTTEYPGLWVETRTYDYDCD